MSSITLEVRSTESRGDALIEDGTYPGPDGDPVDAYLVRPAPTDGAMRPGPGLLTWHWFDPKAPDGDRSQFVDEAVALAESGVVSLLPQGRFPWAADPAGAAADVPAILAEVDRIHRGLDLLAADPGVDPRRLGLVGHDFGGMLAAVAAATDDRLRVMVLIAATPRWGDWFLPFWELPDDRIEYLRALRDVDPIERIGEVRRPAILFQFGRRDFFIAEMTGREFVRAAPDGAEVRWYDDEHDMRHPEVRADRVAFLARGLASAD